MRWHLSHRFDPVGAALADRHYNRRAVGSPQFVPPGRCVVLRTPEGDALWVTSWPFAEYVRHAWPGAWVNSLFRKEGPGRASDFIREAVAATRAFWPAVPAGGIVSFVDPRHVRPARVHGRDVYGYCYLKAGFRHVGFTAGGLWAWQMLEADMPPAVLPSGGQAALVGIA